VGYRKCPPFVRACAPTRKNLLRSHRHTRAPPPDPRLAPGPLFVASGGLIKQCVHCPLAFRVQRAPAPPALTPRLHAGTRPQLTPFHSSQNSEPTAAGPTQPLTNRRSTFSRGGRPSCRPPLMSRLGDEREAQTKPPLSLYYENGGKWRFGVWGGVRGFWEGAGKSQPHEISIPTDPRALQGLLPI